MKTQKCPVMIAVFKSARPTVRSRASHAPVEVLRLVVDSFVVFDDEVLSNGHGVLGCVKRLGCRRSLGCLGPPLSFSLALTCLGHVCACGKHQQHDGTTQACVAAPKARGSACDQQLQDKKDRNRLRVGTKTLGVGLQGRVTRRQRVLPQRLCG